MAPPLWSSGYDRLYETPSSENVPDDCCGRIPSQAQILIDIPSIHTSTSNIETKVAKFYLHVILLARPYFYIAERANLVHSLYIG